MVLGLPWLQETNPLIDWEVLSMSFDRKPESKQVNFEIPSKTQTHVTSKTTEPINLRSRAERAFVIQAKLESNELREGEEVETLEPTNTPHTTTPITTSTTTKDQPPIPSSPTTPTRVQRQNPKFPPNLPRNRVKKYRSRSKSPGRTSTDEETTSNINLEDIEDSSPGPKGRPH
ncbi:hypothetical protein H0H93_002098, partial [Arthromyces matolae]